MGPETRPGGCQVTVHGNLEAGESFVDGLRRELTEELGIRFQRAIFNRSLEDLELLVDDDHPDKEVVTYGMVVGPEVLSLVCFGPSTGGFDFVTCNGVDNIRNLKEFDSKIGVTDLTIVAMFPDEIIAVRKAFEVFSKYTVV